MDKIIVDTSVLIKWFTDEPGSTDAQKILKQQQNSKIQIILPDIVLLELVNALYWAKKFTYEHILIVLEAMSKIKIIYKGLNNSLLPAASLLMIRYKIQSYDALFIALAEVEKCPLITVDRKHHRKEISKRIRYL
jgi:predicted nucleic acid-binding protein